MADKRISALPLLVTPKKNDFFPIDQDGETKRIFLSGLTNYVSSQISLTGGTLNATTGVATFSNANGVTFTVGGFLSSAYQKHWEKNKIINLSASDTIVISGNYVLENSTMTLSESLNSLFIGNINFNQCTQIFIGGSLLLIDSRIINNGIISVAGGVILMGNSIITGSGNII